MSCVSWARSSLSIVAIGLVAGGAASIPDAVGADSTGGYDRRIDRYANLDLHQDSLVQILESIERSGQSRDEKYFAEIRLSERLAVAPTSWLLTLLRDHRYEIRAIGIRAFWRRGLDHPLQIEASRALAALVRDTSLDDELRANALETLHIVGSKVLDHEEIYGFIGGRESVLTQTAAFLFVHERCELWGAREPDPSFESRMRTWLSDPKQPVRQRAAFCLLARGGNGWYDASDSLIRQAIRTLGTTMIDPNEIPDVRGDAIDALGLWTESRLARRFLKRMFDERNWFFGATGQHFPEHSLATLYSSLSGTDWEWSTRQFQKLKTKKERIRKEPGGDFVIWLLEGEDRKAAAK